MYITYSILKYDMNNFVLWVFFFKKNAFQSSIYIYFLHWKSGKISVVEKGGKKLQISGNCSKLLEISLHRKCNIRKVWNISVWCFLSREYAIPKKIYLVHMGACKKALCLRFILFCVTSHSGRHCTQFTPFCMESCFSDEFLRIKIACSLDIC